MVMAGRQQHARVERILDAARLGLFELALDDLAQRQHLRPARIAGERQGAVTLHVDALGFAGPQRAESLVGRVGQERGKHAAERIAGGVHRGLSRTPARGIARVAIEPILGCRAINRRKRLVAQGEDRQLRLAERTASHRIAHHCLRSRNLREHPRLQARVRDRGQNRVGLGAVKAVEVRQQVSNGVAHLAVALASDLEKFAIGANVILVVHARHPPATNIGAMLLQQRFDIDGVADRLGHLATFLVDDEAVSNQTLERRNASRTQRGQQRKLEPTAVLIASLEIHLGGVTDATGAQHRVPRTSRLKPDIKDVLQLGEARDIEPLGRVRIARWVVVREQLLRRFEEPRIAALLGEALGNGAHACRSQESRAVARLERRNRQTPRALARDAPVRARLKHAAHAIASPLRGELHFALDRSKRALTQTLAVALHGQVHADEPLLSGAEDHRRLRSPVMRIRVHELVVMEQVAARAQTLGDLGIGSPNRLAAQPIGNGVVVGAVLAHRAIRRKAFLQTSAIVISAVARSGVHQAGAVLERDIVGAHDATLARAERMVVLQSDQRDAVALAAHDDLLCARLLRNLVDEFAGQNRRAAVDLHQRVTRALMHGNGEIRRKRPRRRGPDHETRSGIEKSRFVDLIVGIVAIVATVAITSLLGHFRKQSESRRDLGTIARLEVNIDREILAVLILKLRLGERGLVGDRPMHGLQRAHDHALIDEIGEDLERLRLVLRHERVVRIGVVGEREQTLHLLGLQTDELSRRSRAFAANRHVTLLRGQRVKLGGLALLMQLGHDLVLDRQAVRVPARHEAHAPTLHQCAAHDHVLQHLVEHVAHVNRPVGVGRPVVKHERLGSFARNLKSVEQLRVLPTLERLRLGLHEVRLHGKRRLGQVERVLVGRLLLRGLGFGHFGAFLATASRDALA